MQHAVVFGAGMVGSVIAEDLVQSGFRVTIADRSSSALGRIAERSNGKIAINLSPSRLYSCISILYPYFCMSFTVCDAQAIHAHIHNAARIQ